jgi:hypothetical protein
MLEACDCGNSLRPARSRADRVCLFNQKLAARLVPCGGNRETESRQQAQQSQHCRSHGAAVLVCVRFLTAALKAHTPGELGKTNEQNHQDQKYDPLA